MSENGSGISLRKRADRHLNYRMLTFSKGVVDRMSFTQVDNLQLFLARG